MCCKGDLSIHIAGRTICRFTDQNAESDENRDMKNLSPDYSIQRAKSGQGIIIDDNFQCCNTRN